MKNSLALVQEKSYFPCQKFYLIALCSCFFSQGFSQPNLDVSGKARIEMMDTVESGSTIVVRQTDGILAERLLNKAII